jgi:glucokinase
MNVMCGDVGGTKSLLAVASGTEILFEKRYDSTAHARFDDIVKAFLAECGHTPARACFAIAGPVKDNYCRATNLPWEIDGNALGRENGLERCLLVNDFHAQAVAVLELPASDLVEIHAGQSGDGPIAVLGAGTGLGQAFLHQVGGRYQVLASEGGHCDFAPTNDLQVDLYRWLRHKHGGRVSYERILAGRGLHSCYEFLRDRDPGNENRAVRDVMAAAEHPAAVVTQYGLDGGDALCSQALDIFCEVYGQEAGNLALKILATGGVYVCGGIAPRILPRLRAGGFERGYLDKGRLGPVVRAIPVRVVTNARSGLIGAAALARRA